jgi:hypothetical protein
MKNVAKIMIGLMAVIFVFLNGCGSGNLANVKINLKRGDINRGQTILVKDFDTTNTLFSGDNVVDASIIEMQKRRIAYDTKVLLISKLTENGFKAYDFKGLNNTDNVVVIECVVTRVNHGSGAWRVIVGFGAGAAWMDATVKIYKANDKNNILAEFQVQSSSEGNWSPEDLTNLLVKELAAAIADYVTRNS